MERQNLLYVAIIIIYYKDLFMSNTSTAKYIKQIRIKGNKTYAPNKFVTPYELMKRLS